VQELLAEWEHGLDRSPTERALGLLATASPGTPRREIAGLPVGSRDLGLLRLRAALFGDGVEATCSCPSCAEQLEVTFRVSDLVGAAAATSDAGTPTSRTLVAGRAVTVRPPSSLDLLAVNGETDLGAARDALLRRCLGGEDGNAVADQLGDDDRARLVAQIAELDPLARVELELRCADCGHAWRSLFDIAGFLWTELDAWARRTLRDVHTLACAYGWPEADILAMSLRRRESYLELVLS
jgi:hypothetical protein